MSNYQRPVDFDSPGLQFFETQFTRAWSIKRGCWCLRSVLRGPNKNGGTFSFYSPNKPMTISAVMTEFTIFYLLNTRIQHSLQKEHLKVKIPNFLKWDAKTWTAIKGNINGIRVSFRNCANFHEVKVQKKNNPHCKDIWEISAVTKIFSF